MDAFPESPFGILASGHSYNFNFHEVDPVESSTKRFIAREQNVGNFDHIYVFIREGFSFGKMLAGSVYVRRTSNPDDGAYLGMISDEKASALFRLQDSGFVPHQDFEGTGVNDDMEFTVVVEDYHSACKRVADERFEASDYTPPSFQKKWMTNFYNYVCSFARPIKDESGKIEWMIPVHPAQAWWMRMWRNLSINPCFWNSFKVKV